MYRFSRLSSSLGRKLTFLLGFQFPGCFYCDNTNRIYKVAEYFHFGCSCFAGMLALSFIAKLVLAQRVVVDELSSPTTASPAGLICMTLVIVFAGRGVIGEYIVCTSAFVHLCLAIWFLYLAMAYHMLPEPSWFPATTGLGIPAIKLWLYYPMAGHFMMSVSEIDNACLQSVILLIGRCFGRFLCL
jgi:hypothetical protein